MKAGLSLVAIALKSEVLIFLISALASWWILRGTSGRNMRADDTLCTFTSPPKLEVNRETACEVGITSQKSSSQCLLGLHLSTAYHLQGNHPSTSQHPLGRSLLLLQDEVYIYTRRVTFYAQENKCPVLRSTTQIKKNLRKIILLSLVLL